MGVGPITFTEIKHWADGEQIKLLPLERRALREIDKAYIEFCNTKESK